MVRPAIVLVVALAATAHAGELPRRMGMYVPQGAALAMLDSKVAVTVHGPIVEATVTQTFRNDTDRVTEATYIFPLPPDAAVSAMAIENGARTIHAAIELRGKAQQRYEQAIAAGVGAGLLDQERPDVFTQTVSAIPAHGTVAITLRFDTTAQYHDGTWELVLPMVVAPRYVPGTASGRPTTGSGHAPDTDRSPDASHVTPGAAPGAGGKTEVALTFGSVVDNVTSPTHEIAGRDTTYAFADPHSDHDAIVRWHARVPASGWVEKDADGGYAAVVVEQPAAAARTAAIRCTFVIDRAATTRGDADAVEHPLVRDLFGALTPKDQVAVVAPNQSRIDWGAPDQALRAVDAGWSKPAGPLDLAKTLASVHGELVLVTDGLVADDAAAIAAAKRVGAPIHVIAIGPAPNRSLLTAIAAATGGTVRFAIIGDDLTALARNVISDAASQPAPLAVIWGTLAATDVVPAILPRLGAGQAALVVARVARVEAANARARGDVFAFTAMTPPKRLEGATTPSGSLARRWARLELDDLLAANDPRAIAAHAIKYGLVSPYTSMVAIGDEVIVKGGVKHSVPVPVSVPAGMRWQEVERQLDVTGAAATGEDLPTAKETERPAKTVAKPDVVEKKTGKHKPHDNDDRTAAKHGNAVSDDESDRKADKAGVVHEEDYRKHKKTAPSPAHAADDDDDGDDDAPKRRSVTAAPVTQAAPAGEPVAAQDEDQGVERLEVTDDAAPASRRFLRLTAALGAGLAIENGNTDALGVVSARVEAGRRTLAGFEGSLWLVGGLHAQGELLATLARRGIAHWLELGVGFGVHLGSAESGPAFDLTLRTLLPVRHLHAYLRYDGALLIHDGAHDGQNAASAGVEASF